MKIEALENLVRNHFHDHPQPFKPIAYWQDSLDQLIVIVKDCSFSEHYPARPLPLIFLEDNYSTDEADRYAGFIVDGAKDFCGAHRLIREESVCLPELLDTLKAVFPEHAVHVDIARRIIEKYHLYTTAIS